MNELNLNLFINIVARAMKDGFTITSCCNRINIQNKEDKYIELTLTTDDSDNYIISILSDKGKSEIKDITDEEVLRFKLLIKDCEKYEKSKLIEDIKSFFIVEEKKEETKKTINDLDNEDD